MNKKIPKMLCIYIMSDYHNYSALLSISTSHANLYTQQLVQPAFSLIICSRGSGGMVLKTMVHI